MSLGMEEKSRKEALPKESKKNFLKKSFWVAGFFVLSVFVLSQVNWLWLMEKTLIVQDPLKKADFLIVPSGAFV